MRYGSTDRRDSTTSMASFGDGGCSICMIELSEDDKGEKQICGHKFHEHCFHSWSVANAALVCSDRQVGLQTVPCPICRHPLEPLPSAEVLHVIGDAVILRANVASGDFDDGRDPFLLIGGWHPQVTSGLGILAVLSYTSMYVFLIYLAFSTCFHDGHARPGDIIAVCLVAVLVLVVWVSVGRLILSSLASPVQVRQQLPIEII